MEQEFVKWIVQQGGTAAVAALAIIFLARSFKERDDLLEHQLQEMLKIMEQERARTDLVVSAIKEFSVVSSELTRAVKELKDVFLMTTMGSRWKKEGGGGEE